jgi:hypothetical protein
MSVPEGGLRTMDLQEKRNYGLNCTCRSGRIMDTTVPTGGEDLWIGLYLLEGKSYG